MSDDPRAARLRDYESAARNFEIDMKQEAARLIELGVPPWDATIQARQRISIQRREKAKHHAD